MNRGIFENRRGMRPIQEQTARLENYRLCFNLPIGSGERGVANLEPHLGACTWVSAIHAFETRGLPDEEIAGARTDRTRYSRSPVRAMGTRNEVGRDKPTPIGATIVTGMNDVLNFQDYSKAARINHIPTVVWFLMILIALFGCVAQGYGAKGKGRKALLVIILPMTLALSLGLIADIDSARAGIIRVQAQNLTRSSSRIRNDICSGRSAGSSSGFGVREAI